MFLSVRPWSRNAGLRGRRGTLSTHTGDTRDSSDDSVRAHARACSGVWYEGSAGSGCIGDFGCIRSGMAPAALYTHLALPEPQPFDWHAPSHALPLRTDNLGVHMLTRSAMHRPSNSANGANSRRGELPSVERFDELQRKQRAADVASNAAYHHDRRAVLGHKQNTGPQVPHRRGCAQCGRDRGSLVAMHVRAQ